MTTSSDTHPNLLRVRKVDVPVMNPGHCAICTNATHTDGFVDPDIFIDWYGKIYFCRDCLYEMARCFGFIPVEEYEAYKKANAELTEELTVLQTSVTALEQSFATLRSLPRYSSDATDSTDSSTEDSEVTLPAVSGEPVEADELITAGDALLAELGFGPGSGSGDESEAVADVTESVTVEGPDDTDESASSDGVVGGI